MVDDVELLQDVMVFEVAEHGDDVHVDIYGGDEHVCASIRFTFIDAGDRRRHMRTLRYWQRNRVPLTFVARGSTVALMNDVELFERAFDTVET